MPRQNRVTPFSTLISTPARGTLMGNRGCLHNANGQIRRPYQGQRWIICVLEFKGRKHGIMTPGQYTELFFLDEATALAAGHRPCAECQRERFNYFREVWVSANPELATSPRLTATALDAILHQERILPSLQLPVTHSLIGIPNGAFVTEDEQTACLVLGQQPLRWTPYGYEPLLSASIRFPIRILTPPSVIRTLDAGYVAGIHPSATIVQSFA